MVISISTRDNRKQVLEGECRLAVEVGNEEEDEEMEDEGEDVTMKLEGSQAWKKGTGKGVTTVVFRKIKGDPMEWRRLYKLLIDRLPKEVIQGQ